MTLYLGNLPETVTAAAVTALFAPYGEVLDVSLVSDPQTGRLRGFGFVTMEAEAGRAAVAALDGIEFQGLMLRVNEARDRGARPPRRAY